MGKTSWVWAEWQQHMYLDSYVVVGFFLDTFCSFSLCLPCWILFEEVAALRCSSKWQKTIWSWELDPEIDCERFWKHFIFTWSVSVFAEWTFTLKPTVLRLVRLCDFYFCSPPPAIGRHYWSLWKAQRLIELCCNASFPPDPVQSLWCEG